MSRKTAEDSLTKGHSAGCFSLRDQKRTMANFVSSKSEMSRSTDSLNGFAFNARYTDPGTDVIANVTSVEDLREKVTLSWKNINVFVPQPRPSVWKRLYCGDKDDEPKIKQILFDGKQLCNYLKNNTGSG